MNIFKEPASCTKALPQQEWLLLGRREITKEPRLLHYSCRCYSAQTITAVPPTILNTHTHKQKSASNERYSKHHRSCSRRHTDKTIINLRQPPALRCIVFRCVLEWQKFWHLLRRVYQVNIRSIDLFSSSWRLPKKKNIPKAHLPSYNNNHNNNN